MKYKHENSKVHCVSTVFCQISQLQQNQQQITADAFFPWQKFFIRNIQVISYFFDLKNNGYVSK